MIYFYLSEGYTFFGELVYLANKNIIKICYNFVHGKGFPIFGQGGDQYAYQS